MGGGWGPGIDPAQLGRRLWLCHLLTRCLARVGRGERDLANLNCIRTVVRISICVAPTPGALGILGVPGN